MPKRAPVPFAVPTTQLTRRTRRPAPRTRSRCRWLPMFRSARSSPAASTRRSVVGADAGAVRRTGAHVHDRVHGARRTTRREARRRLRTISAPSTRSCMSTPATRSTSSRSCPRFTTSRLPIRRRSPRTWFRMLTRQHVTVSLSGDGGDELFCGYGWYLRASAVGRRLEVASTVVRRPSPRSAPHRSRTAGRDRVGARRFRRSAGSARRAGSPPPRRRSGSLATIQSAKPMLRHAVLLGDVHSRRGGDGPKSRRAVPTPRSGRTLEVPSGRCSSTLVSYLPDDLLVKVDRATMAVAPGISPPVARPPRRGVGRAPAAGVSSSPERRRKWLLRRVLAQYVPTRLVDGPKRGFLIPFGEWLRGPLRDWAESLLNETRLRADGFVDAPEVRRKWNHFLSQPASPWNNDLWNVLMFQSWLLETKNLHAHRMTAYRQVTA